MKDLLDIKCRLKHMGDGCYVCAKVIHCPKTKNVGVFCVNCFKVLS